MKELKSKRLDLTGQKFGLLTVTRRAPDYITPNGRNHTSWFCDCECGTKDFRTTTERLRQGNYKSCGCLSKANQFKKKENKYDLSGDFGIGYTLKGEEFYFDLEDYNKIYKYTWYLDKEGYIITNSSGNEYYLMHRLIMGAKDEFDIDHINHKKNDNRKRNLREVTTQQNCSNRKITNKYGINGISKMNDKWWSCIGFDNNLIHLGVFNTKEDAIDARKRAEEKYYGDFSYENSMKLSERNGL